VEKAGINYKAKCPFHNEKTASFFISGTRQSFYCFGCGEKGDIFTFVEKFEGLDFKGALKTLADRAGVELRKFSKEEISGKDKEEREKEKLLEIMEEATKHFEQELKEDKKSLEYLKGRGVTAESIKKWRIGFAREEWRGLHDFLVSKNYSKRELLEVGLIKKVLDEEKYYDTFRNRIVFPICDNYGKVIAFSGRAMKEDDKTPKYLNSPETKLFYKSEALHGFHIAKNHIRKADYTVLVEGQMDLVMSHQAGVLNTVASSGTALTELHLRKIQKLSNRVIIAYDSDPSGEKAALRAAEIALLLGMEVKITNLKEGEDPASVVKASEEEWKEALRNEFALERTMVNMKEKDLAKEVIKNVLPFVSLLKSEMEKSQFIKKIAIKMKVPEEAVRDDLKRVRVPEALQNEISVDEKGWLKDKEAFLFELEKYMKEGDSERIVEEKSKRTELQNLKLKLRGLAITLDDKDLPEKEIKKVKEEFEEVRSKIKELDV